MAPDVGADQLIAWIFLESKKTKNKRAGKTLIVMP